MASTRRQCRAALGTAFVNQGFSQVFTFAPLDLKGATRVLIIHAGPTRHEVLGAGFANNFYKFFLDVYVLRRGDINTEDELDDMHEVIRSVARANVGNAAWNEITLEEESDPRFARVGGAELYRFERHTVWIKVSSD